MKTYKELQAISKQFQNNLSTAIPCNPFLLGNKLHIKIIPSENKTDSPAFFNKYQRAVFYDPSAQYSQYYIFHELAHCILNHTTDGAIEEQEANLLASLLIAPPELIPSYIKSAVDLVSLSHLPIDRAEEYWSELKKYNRSITLHKSVIFFIVPILILFLFGVTINMYFTKNATPIPSEIENSFKLSSHETYYCTEHGERFHLKTCPTVKNNSTLHKITIEEIKEKNLYPCKQCLGNTTN